MVAGEGGGEEGTGGGPTGPEHPERNNPELVPDQIPDIGPDSDSDVINALFSATDFINAFSDEVKATPPRISEEDFFAIGSLDQAALAARILELKSRSDDIKAKKSYGFRLFVTILAWLFLVLCTVWASAIRFHWSACHIWVFHWPIPADFKLSDSVLITLIGSTTANIIGLLYVVVNYLFPRADNNDKH